MKIETQELFVGPANFKQLLINVLTFKVKVNIKLIESFRLKFLVLPNISSFSDESLNDVIVSFFDLYLLKNKV